MGNAKASNRGTGNRYDLHAFLYLVSLYLIIIPGKNRDYKTTFIVQTLTSSTLVLLDTDGDVKGYYTRKTQ